MLRSALSGLAIMGLIAWGISKYDGYVDELLVYQSLIIGLVGGLALSGTYLLFTRSKTTKPAKYHPPTLDYTAPLQSKRTPIFYAETPVNRPVNRPAKTKSILRRILHYITYFSVFSLIGTSLGFLAGAIYLLANIGEIVDDAMNQYSILVFLLLPLQLIILLLGSMTIGGVTGAILGFILKVFRKQSPIS